MSGLVWLLKVIFSKSEYTLPADQTIHNPEDIVWTFTHKEPSSFETLGSQFLSPPVPMHGGLIGLRSDTKSEFSGTESPDPDPRESQICLLGIAFYQKFAAIALHAE